MTIKELKEIEPTVISDATEIKPGCRYIMRTKEKLSPHNVDRIRALLNSLFGDSKIALVGPEFEIFEIK